MKSLRLLLVCCAFILHLCLSQVEYGTLPPEEGEIDGSMSTLARDVLAAMNTSADPCNDPDTFACGGWETTFEMPPEEGRWYKSFHGIRNDTRYMIREVLESGICPSLPDQGNRTRAPADGWEVLLFCWFQACMDRDTLDELGTQPMLDFLDSELPFVLQPSIDGWADMTPRERGSVAVEMLAKLHAWGVKSTFEVTVEQNPITSDPRSVLFLYQSGLNLKYTEYDENDTIASYLTFMTAAHELFQEAIPSTSSLRGASSDGRLSPAEAANASLAIEQALQDIFLTPVEERDPVKVTNQVTLQEVKELAPNIDWDRFLQVLKAEVGPANQTVTNETEIVIHHRDYFRELGRLITEEWDDKSLLAYFQSRLFVAGAGLLSREWTDLRDTFNREVLGVEPKERWDECQRAAARSLLSWVVTHTILKDFDPRGKVIAEEMLANVRTEFAEVLEESTWMSNDTKIVAFEKLDKMADRIAYPEWVLSANYSWRLADMYGPEDAVTALDVSFFNMSFYLKRQGIKYAASFHGRERDEEVWYRTPTDVNAYYHPYYNEMVFLAGIIAPPKFHVFDEDDPENEILAKKVLNYAALGGIMGHELTHGFDDAGSQYDADAKLRNWWSEDSKSAFNQSATCVDAQYSSYVALTPADLPGLTQNMTLNGRLSMGENIADMGGIKLAFRALSNDLTEEEMQTRPLEGVDLTVEQLFFVGWGQDWCEVTRPKTERSQLGTAVHSPGRFRSLGPISNMPEFAAAFDCPADSVVNRRARQEDCQVW
ncbi:unnamed protein product [Vitrella brassicaformis CCMP3155]|uniref:Peptidase M13 C-terminal domain-containing protein n=2 Tax=Vitrella brassicaformis TaxID=1169539 RepID=A0A0G4EYK9_VITBC|nr:unnamed protein product [Vitrella brassicaformis CCMP3155]|mmetsp:Transcript_27173/g.67798  ORF Transcript_27173/g.67798 Transcript_27173/m.67798 type:complete len:770 (+) Transcript_27173:153-2462(+)|eukprot:CEM04245.1 unnamed protein product [Vitrella brassicaformis CCMP3155]